MQFKPKRCSLIKECQLYCPSLLGRQLISQSLTIWQVMYQLLHAQVTPLLHINHCFTPSPSYCYPQIKFLSPMILQVVAAIAMLFYTATKIEKRPFAQKRLFLDQKGVLLTESKEKKSLFDGVK